MIRKTYQKTDTPKMTTVIVASLKQKIKDGQWKKEDQSSKMTASDWHEFLAKHLVQVENPREVLYLLIHGSDGVDWLPSPFTGLKYQRYRFKVKYFESFLYLVLKGFQLWMDQQANPGIINQEKFVHILLNFYDYKANTVVELLFDLFGAKSRACNEIQEAFTILLQASKIDYEKVGKLIAFLDLRDKFSFVSPFIVLLLILRKIYIFDRMKLYFLCI